MTSKAQLCLKRSKPTRIVYVLLFFDFLRAHLARSDSQSEDRIRFIFPVPRVI